MTYELHPACAAWPQMTDDALDELAADIKANGLHDPLTLTPDGKLLDGRNRMLACERVGVEPTTIVYSGDPYLFSLSKNKQRRHMGQDQIALVAAAGYASVGCANWQ
jgi:ParB-like chromosome segregation protein Spo0J